jgi:hypothetical protein
MTTQVHDSHACALDSGQPCEMCRAANEYERKQLLLTGPELIALAAPIAARLRADLSEPWSFDDDWELAPLSMTRTTERECAQYWYEMGARAKERELLKTQNADMQEMLAREKIAR